MINADKPQQWKADIAASVDLFNSWFIQFAPLTYRETRARTTEGVKQSLVLANDMAGLSPATLLRSPGILPTLRMSTAPPIAVDRLAGLSNIPGNLIKNMESGKLPPRMNRGELDKHLEGICTVIIKLLDDDIFPWLSERRSPTDAERFRASTIVADRLCGSQSNPIIRNAQEKRQLDLIDEFLITLGYRKQPHPNAQPITDMEPGTFIFRRDLMGGSARNVKIPIDIVIQPKTPRPNRFPVLVEAKSAGDYTNTNKRRKEEATKVHQLHDAYGAEAQLILFLCDYFNSGYLGYEAAEGLDWVWEHRIGDLMELGI